MAGEKVGLRLGCLRSRWGFSWYSRVVGGVSNDMGDVRYSPSEAITKLEMKRVCRTDRPQLYLSCFFFFFAAA